MPTAAAPSRNPDLSNLGPDVAQRSRGNRRDNAVERLKESAAFLWAERADPIDVLPDCLAHHIALGPGKPRCRALKLIHGLFIERERSFHHTTTILPYLL